MNWIGVDKLNVLLIHPEVDRLLHEKPSWFTLGLTWFHWLWAADASPPSSFWPQSWCEGWGWTGQNTETQNVSGVALNNFPSHKWSFTKSKKKALVENDVLVFYFSLKRRQNTSSGLKEKQVHLQHCTLLQTQTSPSESSSCRGRRSLAELPQYFQTPPANGWKMGTNWVNNIKNHQNHWEMSMCKQKSIWLYTNVARDTVSAQSHPHLSDALWGHVADDLCRHVEVLWSHVAQGDAVLGQQLGEGMNRAAVFQIPNHGYLKGNASWIHQLNTGSNWRLVNNQTKSWTAVNDKFLTVMPLTVPSSSRIVKTSSSAWVGCSPTPSPALITGLRHWREALWRRVTNQTVITIQMQSLES